MIVGVIGSGAISGIYLANMIGRFKNLTVKGLASKDYANALKKAEEHGIIAYASVEDLLADNEIELVIVLTPVGTHYELIKQALQSGKHVYTEKTITDDPLKAKELLKLADEKKLVLGSAPDTFLGAAWQNARRILDKGTIGEIQSFVMSANRDNNILLSVFPFLRQPGCGVLYDYGVYYITCLCALLGPVARVSGICRTPYPVHRNILPMSPDFGKEMNTPNESQVAAILQLKNGITGTLNINCDSNMYDQAFFTIYGTKGILYLCDPNQFGGTVRLQMNCSDPNVPNEPKTVMNFFDCEDNSRGIGPSDLAEAIAENRTPRASKEMAAHVLEVLNAILRSSEEDWQPVTIQSAFEMPLARNNCHVPIRNTGHLSFNMKNEEEMLHFYRDILGMKEQFTLNLNSVLEGRFAEAGSDPVIPEEYAWIKDAADKPWLTYLRLADGQFVEMFYDMGRNPRTIENRREIYGYTKMNFEVVDIHELKKTLTEEGVELAEDIHPVLDGSLELTVHDPDGNEIQFTQYSSNSVLNTDEEECRYTDAKVKYTTQAAFDVHDSVNMPAFYEYGLSLKKKTTLYVKDLIDALRKSNQADENTLTMMGMIAEQPWIEYYETGTHQYIELFYSLDGKPLREDRNLEDSYGYQHLCLEVEDIHKAWDAVRRNGITPENEITRGLDGALQFWIRDPDGNRIELMEYAEGSLQLTR